MSKAQELLDQVDQMMRRNRSAESAEELAAGLQPEMSVPDVPVLAEPALTVREPEVPVLTEPVATLGEPEIPILTEPVETVREPDIPTLTEQAMTVRAADVPGLAEPVNAAPATAASSDDVPVLTHAIGGFTATGEPSAKVASQDSLFPPTSSTTPRPPVLEPASSTLQPTSAIDDARWSEIADEVRDDVLRGLGLATAVGPLAEIDARAQRIADRVAAEIGVILHAEIERLLRERVAEAVARAVAEAQRRA